MAWIGKVNFDGKVLETSTAHKFLFSYDIGQSEDYEAKLRPDLLAFDRQIITVDRYNPHTLSYTGFFTRMKTLYNFELFILFILISIYHMVLIMLYAMIHSTKDTAAKYMMFMMTMDRSAITMEEI